MKTSRTDLVLNELIRQGDVRNELLSARCGQALTIEERVVSLGRVSTLISELIDSSDGEVAAARSPRLADYHAGASGALRELLDRLPDLVALAGPPEPEQDSATTAVSPPVGRGQP